VKLVFSNEAKQDLIEIGDQIAADSPKRAAAFVKAPRTSALKLAQRPKAFAIVPRYAHLGIRRHVHGNYLIFYRINDDRVSIIRILHGARDYDALLGVDDRDRAVGCS
jgi:plasmid stabilization system protein ParE